MDKSTIEEAVKREAERFHIKEALFGGAMGFLITFLGAMVLYKDYEQEISPREYTIVDDLNKDNVQDAILKKNNGIKIPMYGINPRENGIPKLYISAKEMLKRNYEDIINYSSIARRLNEKPKTSESKK